MNEGRLVQMDDASRLLRSVAEQMKVPLTIIARQAELAGMVAQSQMPDEALRSIRVQSDIGLRLVDGYLLGLQLLEQERLLLEPVSLAAMLTDAAHDLCAFADLCNVELEVYVAGRYAPVMANAQALRAALLSLGYNLIEASSAAGSGWRRDRLALAVHRTPRGMVTGMYSEFEELTAQQWRGSEQLVGRATQALPSLTPDSGAGVFVAGALFTAMDTKLRVGRFQKQTGLAATFMSSRQLQLV